MAYRLRAVMLLRSAPGARRRFGVVVAAALCATAWGCASTGRTMRFVHVVQCPNGYGDFVDDLDPAAPAWKSEQDYLDCRRAAPPILEDAAKRWSKAAFLHEIRPCAEGQLGSLRHNDVVYMMPQLPRCGSTLVTVRKRLARGGESPEFCIDPMLLSETRPGAFDRGEWLLIEPRVDQRMPSEVAWRQRGRFKTHHDCAARRWELLQELEGAGQTPPSMECKCRRSPQS